MKTILIVNGPNLNLLGERDPESYGEETLDEINKSLQKIASDAGVDVIFIQSNSEGDIIDELQSRRHSMDGLVINPGALTHYSYALRDALEMIQVPIIEVHLSNIHKRDEWRKKSVTAETAIGVIAGFQGDSYRLALHQLINSFS